MKKYIPLDINAIKNIGIENWQKSYYWPISDKSYTKLIDKLWDEFDKMYIDSNYDLKNILLSDTKFISFMSSYLHCNIVKSIGENENYDILSGKLSEVYLNPDWRLLGDSNKVSVDLINRHKLKIKGWVKRLIHNNHLGLFKNLMSFFRISSVWSIGSTSQIKKTYVKEHGCYCNYQYIESIIPKSVHCIDSPDIDILSKKIQKFVTNISLFCENNFDFSLPLDDIKECWVSRLTHMMQIYRYAQVIKHIPEKLLLTEVAKPLHKIIALAFQSKGCQVIGFSHGNDVGNLNRRLQGYNEYAQCDLYICPTEKSKELRGFEYSGNKLSDERVTTFQSIELKLYKDIFDLNKIEQPVDYVRTVMIIGYPMNTIRYQYSAGDFFYFQLDLEIKLAKLLNKNGYRVIYKVHPDRADSVKGIFDDIVDEILVTPFEKTYQFADAIVFGCLTSTTFGYAVNTNKPIYLLDIEGQFWNKGVRKLLQKRCTMVTSFFDKSNRIIFDEDYIIDKLKEKQFQPNYEYVEKLMFPMSNS